MNNEPNFQVKLESKFINYKEQSFESLCVEDITIIMGGSAINGYSSQ